MAPKKPSGKPAASGKPDAKTLPRLAPPAIRKIWSEISLGDWKAVLTVTDHRPEGGQWTIHNDRIHGVCPFHSDSKPSFVIDTTKRYAKCHGCGEYFWNPIQFWMKFRTVAGSTPTSYAEALKDLKDRFELREISQKLIGEMTRRWKHRQMKRLLHLVTQNELVQAATADPKDARYGYLQRTLRYLDYRNIPRSTYKDLPIGVLPTALDLEADLRALAPLPENHNLDPDEMWGMAKAYLAKPFLEDTAWQGAVIFYCGDNPNEPCGVKLRQVPMQLPSKGASSSVFGDVSVQNPDPKIMMWVKDELEEDQHGLFGLYGTPLYYSSIADGKLRQFHIVEGEFDALNIMANQLVANNGHADINFLCFSGGGGNVPSLDFTREFGFDRVYIIPDKDEGGEKFAKTILESTFKMTLHIFRWPDSMIVPGKPKMDPDDAVKNLGLEAVTREFRTPTNFQMPYQWAAERALQDMVGIDVADVKTLTNKAGFWGIYVRDKAEQNEYIRTLQQRYPTINPGDIRSKINSQDANEESFIERIYDALKNRLYVMEQLQDRGSMIVRTFDTTTQRLCDFRLNDDRQIIGAIQAFGGGDVYKFIRENVGDPGFIEGYDALLAKGGQFYLTQCAEMERYACEAVARLTSAMARTANTRRIGTGFHVAYRMIDGVEHTIGFEVNGMTLFKRDYTGDNMWHRCPGPTDDNIVVYAEPDNYPREMFPQFKTEADINAAPTMTLSELYDEIYNILFVGWRFKNHETSCQVMAAFLMLGFVSDIFARQPVIMLNAEHSSGKSSLIGGLINGTAKRPLTMVDAAFFTDNYTVAGIKNICNNGRFILACDEFEDKGIPNDPKSRAVGGCLGLFRPLANDGGVTVQGVSGSSGRAVTYHIRLPVITAAIRSVIAPEDLSRFIHLELEHITGRHSPDIAISDKFGPDILEKLRKQLPLVMFNAVPALIKAHKEIVEEYRHGIDVQYGDIARSREQYYGLLAIMKAAGKNYDAWLKAHYRANQGLLARIAQASISSDIFRILISTPVIDPKNTMDDTNEQRRTIKSMLASTGPEALNMTGTGVYYCTETAPDDEKVIVGHYLVVDWSVARSVYLKNSEWANRMSADIKGLASRSKYHLDDALVLRKAILDKMRHQLHGTPIHDISVFNVQDLIYEANISRKTIKVIGMEDLDVASEFKDELAAFEEAQGKKNGGTGTSSSSPTPTLKKKPSDDFDY